MSILDTLVTDRTQADADRAAELAAKGLNGMTPAEVAEYLAGMKGAYNAADLNRVAEAMEYVAERFQGYGYAVKLAHTRAWSMSDIPDPAEMDGYLLDLAALRGVLAVFRTTPEVPQDMEGLTVQEANDIEKILVDVDSLLTLMAGSFLRCGAAGVFSGARGLPTEGGVAALTWAELDALGLSWADWGAKTWFKLLYGR